jgi:hypothetical protein
MKGLSNELGRRLNLKQKVPWCLRQQTLVCGEGAGLVGADEASGTERLNGVEALDKDVLLCKLPMNREFSQGVSLVMSPSH